MKRRFRNLINEFKEPILKQELKRFILEGLLLVFVLAFILGAMEFLVQFTRFQVLGLFSFLIYLVILRKRLHEKFSYYHILYSLLAVVFLILGEYVMGVSGQLMVRLYYKIPITAQILNPLFIFSYLFDWNKDFFGITMNMLNIVIYIIIIHFLWQNMKR